MLMLTMSADDASVGDPKRFPARSVVRKPSTVDHLVWREDVCQGQRVIFYRCQEGSVAVLRIQAVLRLSSCLARS